MIERRFTWGDACCGVLLSFVALPNGIVVGTMLLDNGNIQQVPASFLRLEVPKRGRPRKV
jgi:hypothetical protein